MYHDLIRSELNEAATTLQNFIGDDANIDAIQRAAVLLLIHSKRVAKCCPAAMGVHIAMLCILQKS